MPEMRVSEAALWLTLGSKPGVAPLLAVGLDLVVSVVIVVMLVVVIVPCSCYYCPC